MDVHLPAWQRGGDLCRGEPKTLAHWSQEGHRWWILCAVFIVLGSGCYGLTIGFWRSPLQGLYTGIKLPMLLLLVASGNALLNGLLAILMGARMSFTQTFSSILMSFSIAAFVLGSLSPVFLFMLVNMPPQSEGDWNFIYNCLVLFHVGAIAFAGIISNLRLYALLQTFVDTRRRARIIMVSWLIGNLLLGAQLSWNLRPFFGTPEMSVEFFRHDAFDRNFFEAIGNIFEQLNES